MTQRQRWPAKRPDPRRCWAGKTAGILILAVLVGCKEQSATPEAQAGAHGPAATQAGDPGANSDPTHLKYGRPRELGRLKDKRLNESSGIARSNVRVGSFWTHNDGKSARLYLISHEGQTLGTVKLTGAQFVDCEDIASFSRAGKHYLLYADTGDNNRERSQYQLHLLEEPALAGDSGKPQRVAVEMTLTFRYPDGPHDCEAVAVDPALDKVYLATKEKKHGCLVYELDLPAQRPSAPLEARLMANLLTPRAAAMDISPDGARAILLTDDGGYEFTRRPGETWRTAFAERPARVRMPPRVNGEAVCYGADGKSLYLTSEGLGQPFWEIPPVE